MTHVHAVLRRLCRLATVCAASLVMLACATPDESYSWPATQVGVEQLQLVSKMKVGVFYNRNLEKRPSGTTVLKVHVDEEGAVRRVSLIEGSGNPRLDESAVDAMRTARFKPYVQNGAPVAVTALAPMRFPGGR